MPHFIPRTGFLFALGCLLCSCMLMDDSGAKKNKTGYVRLQLALGQSQSALMKSASADTTFSLDSLLVVLTAPGQAAQVHRYALSGRADLEDIPVPALTFELAGLREWTAKFISIDTTLSPARRDTVHLDSVKFDVLMADTTVVEKTISPVYSILRVRFWSTMADSIPNNVVYLRVRVNGVTRDSMVLGGKNASLKWLQTMPGSVIYAVGDSGRFLRSTNDAQTSDASAWEEHVLGLHSLSGGCFPSLAVGYVFSAPGQTYHTDDSGKTFTTRYLQPDSVNACYFPNVSTGFTVGQRGGIYKTENNGNSFFTLTSNTPHHLNAIAFPTANVGYVVGENETILKTVNGTAPGGAPAEFGGIVWSPVAGGWFTQTSNTSVAIRDVQFITADTGWAVGGTDYLRVTYDGGAVWSSRDIGSLNPNALTFTAPTRGWIASDGGGIRTFISQYDWRSVASGTTANLYDIRGVGNDTVYAVGANGTIRRTINAGNVPANPHLVSWTGQTLPGVQGWLPRNSGASGSFHALHFADANTGWAVGAAGTVRATTDGGESWAEQISGASTALRAVQFTSASNGVAVGDAEAVVRTTNGGAAWTSYSSGWNGKASGTSSALRGIHFADANTGWTVGAAGTVRATTDGGETWSAQNSNVAPDLKSVHASSVTNALAVGAGESIARTTNGGSNWIAFPVGWVAGTSGTSDILNSVHFADLNTGWAVGAGGAIRKTDDAGGSWGGQASNVTLNLRAVRALGGNEAVAVGDSERVVRTTDGGANWLPIAAGWSAQASGLGTALNGAHFRGASTGWAVGDGGAILATTDGGASWTPHSSGVATALRGVFALSASGAVVAAGDNGVIKRTADGGDNWTTVNSGVATHLRALYFSGATGWAVGASGAVRYSSNSGSNWTAQTGASGTLNAVFSNGARVWVVGDGGLIFRRTDLTGGALSSVANGSITAQNLHGVYFTSSNVGYIVGAGGLIARCSNSNNDNWTLQTSNTSATLRHVFFKGNGTADTGYVVGDGGVVLKTVNAGTTWTRILSGTNDHLYALAMSGTSSDSVYAVGAAGTILKTVSGGNWSNRGTSQTLRGLYFHSAAIGYAVGDSGTLLRTLDGGLRWRPLASGTTARLNAVAGTSTAKLLAVGDGGVVVRSANPTSATPTWNLPSQTATTENLYGVALTTANFAYAVGANGVIIKASVANNTPWTLQTSNTNATLRHVFFKGNGTADTGYAVGDGGVVVKTVNGGTLWTVIASGTTEHLYALYMSGTSSDTVYAVGAAGTVRKTTAGGHWSDRATPQELNAVVHYSASTAFAAGDSGVILRSQNGGASWRAQASGVTTRLNGLYTNGARVWAVGDNGVIRRSTNPTSAVTTWSALASGVTEKLNAVWFTSNDDFGYVVGDNGLVLKTSVDANTPWTVQAAGKTGEDLVAVYGRGNGVNDTVYAVGVNGTILKSVNGTWTVETSGTGQNLNAVYAHTGNIAVAAGNAGAVRKTMAGGTWSGGAAKNLRGLAFHSPTLGFAAGESGTLLRTQTGGVTWAPLASGVATALNGVFANGSRVWAVGDNGVIRRSTDPTATTPTWSTLASGVTEKLNAVHFTANAVGYAVGDNGLILKTIVDANNAWTQQFAGLTSEDLVHVHFRGNGASNGANDTGFAVGANGTILRTTNGGALWTLDASGTGEDLNGVYVQNGNVILAAGAGGVLLKNNGAPFNTATLRSVHPVTSALVYTVGASGTIGKTTDGGTSWVLQESHTTQALNGVSFLNASTGYAVGNGGTILKTTDGGTTWAAQASNTSEHLLAVQILSNDTVYVTGASGLVLKTVNGGAVWYTQETPNANALNSVYFLNRDVGYAVGNNGTILNAVNQGDNWTGGGIKRSLKSVYFINADTGWIVGADAVILKTVNGGAHWVEQHRDAGVTLYGIYFVNNLVGWAVGENGTVLKTANGGATWTPQSSGTSITLRSVNFRDVNRGFILGGTESILETFNGGASWGGLFVGVPGDRVFDRTLSTKYLKANQPQQVIIEAMDRFSAPLRGYQSVISLNLGAGQDSTFVSPMAKCGYDSPVPACAP
jgi:photosystem II stability/assembly factor-like uncharacterized protein